MIMWLFFKVLIIVVVRLEELNGFIMKVFVLVCLVVWMCFLLEQVVSMMIGIQVVEQVCGLCIWWIRFSLFCGFIFQFVMIRLMCLQLIRDSVRLMDFVLQILVMLKVCREMCNRLCSVVLLLIMSIVLLVQFVLILFVLVMF